MKLPVPIRPAVLRMRPYHPPLEGRAASLRFDFNENTVGCVSGVRRALARLRRERLAMYPEYEEASKRLAGYFRVRSDELILTNGTDDALHLLVNTFIDPGSTVLLIEPTFAMYRFYAELSGAHIQTARYTERMEFPLTDVVRRLARGPRLLFLANPNNPTGTLVEPATLRRILRAARRTIVVVDEAYADFSGVSVLPWVRRYPNLVVTRTLSKAAGLAGLRLGCLFAHRSYRPALRKAHSPYPVNTAALAAALVVANHSDYICRYARQVRQARSQLEQALSQLGVKTFPSAGNFLLADFGPRAPRLLAQLRARGILLRDRRSDFGPAGYVRITVGTPIQTRKLIHALKQLW